MSRPDIPVRFTGQTGAGLYGGVSPSHKTKCPHSNNPHGHSRECVCGWYEVQKRDSQIVPYLPPEPAQLHEFFKDS